MNSCPWLSSAETSDVHCHSQLPSFKTNCPTGFLLCLETGPYSGGLVGLALRVSFLPHPPCHRVQQLQVKVNTLSFVWSAVFALHVCRGQRLTLGVLFSCSPPYFWAQSLSELVEFPNFSRRADRESSCFQFPSAGIAFLSVLGMQAQVFTCAQ